MAKYVLALDQGTTSSRSILFTRRGTDQDFRPEGVSPDLSVSRTRRARSRSDLEDPAVDGTVCYQESEGQGLGHLGDWHHQSAGNGGALGSGETGKPIDNAIVWQSQNHRRPLRDG